MKIRAGGGGQRGLWATTVSRMSYSPQAAARDPGSAPFISGYRPPTAGTDTLAPRVDAAGNRTGARNYHHSRFTSRRAKQCDISVADHFNLADIQILKRVFHPRAQLF